MLTKLSLRLRIFLFFCLLALGALIFAAGSFFLAWSRSGGTQSEGTLWTGLILFGFLNSGLVLTIWLLFDEHVAKPIQALSARLRIGAQAGKAALPEGEIAPYLGDLAPAAEALTRTASASLMETAARVAEETQKLRRESARLTDLLTEIPIATILLNPAREIVLYDGQAASVLARIAPPRLKAPLADYFDMAELDAAIATLAGETAEASLTLFDRTRKVPFEARLKALGESGHILFIDLDPDAAEVVGQRPLVFDFDLLEREEARELAETPLSELCFVPFDTETTGLSVETDAIVQLGALRILKGRLLEGEVMETFVNPGRPIPPASTRIHGVTNEDVAGAPDIVAAGRAFHQFTQGAVLVAHNAPFDIGLLRKDEARMGVRWDHPVLDTVLLSAILFGITEDHSLDALCARFSITIPPEERHTALGDARATAEVLLRLLPLLEARGLFTFGALVAEAGKYGRLLQDMNA